MRLDLWMPATMAGLLSLGCASEDDSLTDEMPEELPAGQSDTDGMSTGGSTGGSSGAASDDAAATGSSSTGGPECRSSEDCLGNDVCVSTWDAQTQSPGEPECSFSCIPSLDDTRWCADASACCDPEASCTERGYCVPPQDAGSADTGSGGDEESTSSGGGSSTGADTTGGER